jgi:hypothetical protein
MTRPEISLSILDLCNGYFLILYSTIASGLVTGWDSEGVNLQDMTIHPLTFLPPGHFSSRDHFSSPAQFSSPRSLLFPGLSS